MESIVNTRVETYTDWRDYYELTKPRVVMLIVFTAIVGMFVSVPGWPGIITTMYLTHASTYK
jgi:protoheme IX farnesyltransferase